MNTNKKVKKGFFENKKREKNILVYVDNIYFGNIHKFLKIFIYSDQKM